MKKVYWQLIALAALVVVGFVLVRYYPSLIQKDTSDNGEVVTPTDEIPLVEDVVGEGVFIVYQTTRVVDRGTEDWANDDIRQTDIYARQVGEDQSRLITSIKVDESFGGLAWAEVIGQQILVHRYSAEGDALIDIDGTVHLVPERPFNRVASRDGSVWVDYAVDYDNRAALVSFTVQRGNQLDNNQGVVAGEIDPAELGITMGYAMPFIVSDDGNTVYFRQICECDAPGLLGLWAYDVATQKLSRISYVMDNRIYEYQINPATHQLIGVSYTAPDGLGEEPTSPSAIHLVDLKTGEGKSIFSQLDFVFGSPFLSPDGTWYAHDYRDDIVRVRAVGAPRENSDNKVSGDVINWFDNTLVVNRNGEIILYNLETDTVTSIARSVGGSYADPDQVRVEYVGTIER